MGYTCSGKICYGVVVETEDFRDNNELHQEPDFREYLEDLVCYGDDVYITYFGHYDCNSVVLMVYSTYQSVDWGCAKLPEEALNNTNEYKNLLIDFCDKHNIKYENEPAWLFGCAYD